MEDQEDYYMGNTFRGLAVIIANETFCPGHPNRRGAKEDALQMTTLFQALDFHVMTFMDMTADLMKTTIKNASTSLINLDADCFVLVLSSHGTEEAVSEEQRNSNSNTFMYLPNDAEVWRHAILGVDGKPVYVDDMLGIFDHKKNKQSFLNGKPKLFFLQACRSGHLSFRKGPSASVDTGVVVKVNLSDANLSQMQPSDAGLHDDYFTELVNSLADLNLSQEAENAIDGVLRERRVTYEHLKTRSEVEVDPNPVPARAVRPSLYDIVPLPCPDDCLVMYPAVAGKFGFRNSGTGSYMIHYMFQEMNRNLLFQGYDILQYVTSVNNAMANTYEVDHEGMQCKMTACITHRLTKTLKFEPKRDRSVLQGLKERKTF